MSFPPVSLLRNFKSLFSALSFRLLERPTKVHICPTDRCCLPCRQCDLWKKKPRGELTTEQWKSLIRKLRLWLGEFNINFSGGEPFMRKDLIEILKYCHKLGIRTSSNTNGYLIDRDVAKGIAQSCVDFIIISLDSMNPQIHDFIRGRKGSHRRAIDAIKYVKENSPRTIVIVATIIMGNNLNEIPQIVNWVESIGGFINFQALYQNFGSPYDPGWFKKSHFWPKSSEKVSALIDFLIERKVEEAPITNPVEQLLAMKSYFCNPNMDSGLRCRAGWTDFAINCKGEMLLCFELDPVGDLLSSEPWEIWHSPIAKQRRVQIDRCNRSCRLLNCNFAETLV